MSQLSTDVCYLLGQFPLQLQLALHQFVVHLLQDPLHVFFAVALSNGDTRNVCRSRASSRGVSSGHVTVQVLLTDKLSLANGALEDSDVNLSKTQN